MYIDDPGLTTAEVWEGELAAPDGVYAPGHDLPLVSVGRPVWWGDKAVLGSAWVSPTNNQRYGLARFSFSLRPKANQHVISAELIVYLSAAGDGMRPVAFDAFPKLTTEDQTGTRTLGIDPKVNLVDAVELSGVKYETTINTRQAVPVIVADGIGESTVRWVFEARKAHPLVGSQSTYVVVQLPPGVEAARASLYLSILVGTRIGPVRGILPQNVQERLSFVLE